MKKIIFLLILAVVLASFMPALDMTAHPPGVNTLEAALTSCGEAGCYTVFLVTVPVNQDVICVLPAGITALLTATIIKHLDTWDMAEGAILYDFKPRDAAMSVDYYLRL